MSINKISIKNCKSIDSMEIILNKNINCFIGTNNVGKSNIMKIINFFYVNLTKTKIDTNMFNKSNPYNDEIEISVEYDFNELIEKKKNSQYENSFFSFLETNNELFEKIEEYSKEYTRDNKVTVSLRYNKSGALIWSHTDYEFRSFLSVRFPIFFLESRNIDLYKWDSLWDVIGTIAPFRNKIKIASNISGLFDGEEQESNNYNLIIEIIQNTFKESGVILKKSTVYQQISQIVKLQLGGSEFNYDSHSLKTGSYGMNSYTYIKIYVDLILHLFEKKYFAEPLIMLDEPELHLHVKRIEEFILDIKKNKKYQEVKWIFATHSPPFVKNVIIENQEYNIFHVTNSIFYNNTSIRRISGFKKKKHRLLSDNEANLFFSEACLFVEGETELELFKNFKILNLFPKLNKYDIYSFDGKNDKLQLVNPGDRKTKIKYLVLLDLDKIITYVPEKSKFSITGSPYLNPLKNKDILKKESYHYRGKFQNLFVLRNELKTMISKERYFIDPSGLSIVEESKRVELVEKIQDYLLHYNFFPLQTTIEGAIITLENKSLVYEWLMNSNFGKKDSFNHLYSGLKNDAQKLNFLRVIFFGKTDWLSSENNSAEDNNNYHNIYLKVKKIRSSLKNSDIVLDGKSSGWISKFLEWFFTSKMDPSNTKTKFEKRSVFLSNFPELGKVIAYLESMV